ncbi:MAG: DNA topoisomerase IV [Flavobacteriales bacterium]|jgi:hypothetical protein|nr:DNA topoisomerase IV [Flavobacteriales bacterium]
MRILFLPALCILCISCYTPERRCTDFKTGTFEFEALVGTEILKTTFFRNDSIEIDYFKGKADTSSIRWINDCEYIVKKLKPKNMAEEKAIHMKILTTDKDTYIFEYNIVGQSTKERGTAKKVN